jgi:hypothetical protein
MPLDTNSQANALGFTQSHFRFTIKQERRVEGHVLGSRECQDDQNAKRGPHEPANNYLQASQINRAIGPQLT